MSKDQINLPKTVFSMKANLPAKEPNLVKYWDEIKLYETLRKKAKGKEKIYTSRWSSICKWKYSYGYCT